MSQSMCSPFSSSAACLLTALCCTTSLPPTAPYTTVPALEALQSIVSYFSGETWASARSWSHPLTGMSVPVCGSVNLSESVHISA